MAAEILSDLSRANDNNGSPLEGAQWFFYATGTLTPQAIYTSAALDTEHSNPVVADAAGRFAPIYFDAALTYRGILKNSAGATISGMDIDPINAGIASLFAGSGGAALVGFIQTGTGAVARTLQAKGREFVSVIDFGAVADGTTDDTAAFNAAWAAHPDIYVPAGTYNIAGMVIPSPTNNGQRTMHLAAGATLTRTTGASTDPLVWLKWDDCYIIGAGTGSIIRSTLPSPDGLVIIGHRDMATSHANVLRCGVSGVRFMGMTNYGATAGSPDKLLRLVNPQIGGLASYFHTITDCEFEAANYGITFEGFANGNKVGNLDFQYIGNATLTAHRAAILVDGAQENQIFGFFFHFSPGSFAVDVRDNDNTGTAGGSNHVPQWNVVDGICEQDPTPSGGIALKAPDSQTTATFNTILLGNNVSANDIGNTFLAGNTVHLRGSQNYWHHQQRAPSFVAIDDETLPTDRSVAALSLDSVLLRGLLQAQHSGAAWRDFDYKADNHRFYSSGASIVRIGAKGLGYEAAQGGTVTQATNKATGVTLNKPTGAITMNAASLAAATAVSFTLTNSAAELGDLVAINHVSGGTLAAYTLAAIAGAGSVTITVRNNTAGALAEALVLRFALIKSGDG